MFWGFLVFNRPIVTSLLKFSLQESLHYWPHSCETEHQAGQLWTSLLYTLPLGSQSAIHLLTHIAIWNFTVLHNLLYKLIHEKVIYTLSDMISSFHISGATHLPYLGRNAWKIGWNSPTSTANEQLSLINLDHWLLESNTHTVETTCCHEM